MLFPLLGIYHQLSVSTKGSGKIGAHLLNYSSHCVCSGSLFGNSPLIVHLNIFNKTLIFAFVKI